MLTDPALTVLAAGPQLLNPDYLAGLGLLVVLAVVFAETGLLVGFFLPGDSLLFTAGLLVADGTLNIPLGVLLLSVPVAAIAGDQLGFLLGRRAGPALLRRPDTRLFKTAYVKRADAYFTRYGARTVVIARFVPIVRTFTPLMAGVAGMRYRTFVSYNVLGGVLWGAGVVLLGFSLGQVPFVHDHVQSLTLLIVAVSVLPIGVELIRARAAGSHVHEPDPAAADISSRKSVSTDAPAGTDAPCPADTVPDADVGREGR